MMETNQDTTDPNRKKKISGLRMIIYSLLPLLVLLITAELVLRAVYFQRNNKETFALKAMVEKFRNRNRPVPLPGRYIRLRELEPYLDRKEKPDEEYLKNSENLVGKEYRIRTDSNGFILPQHKFPDAAFSIIFLGGSTTECLFVEEEKRFPYVVGQRLNRESGKKINVFNSGVSGNHTYHTIDLLLNKIIPLQPKYVVLMEAINDWTTLLFEGTYWNANPSRSLIIDPNSKVVVSEDEWASLRGKKLTPDLNHIVDEYSKAQQTFIAICRANGTEPILMTQANRYLEKPDENILKYVNRALESFGLTYEDVKRINIAMNESIRNTAMKHQVALIDLEKVIPKSGELMYDIVHFNNKGSVMAGEYIGDELLKIVK